MYVIESRNLTKKFGKLTVFENLNINVKKGEVLVIIGPSGSGKSTFLRCLNHIEIPTDGEVFVEGKKLNIKNKKRTKKNYRKSGYGFSKFQPISPQNSSTKHYGSSLNC